MSFYLLGGYIIRVKSGGYIIVGSVSKESSGAQNKRSLYREIKGQRPEAEAIGKGTLMVLGRDSWAKGEVLKICATIPWLAIHCARKGKNYREGLRCGFGRSLE